MGNTPAGVRDLERNDVVHLSEPDIGEVTVLIPEPRKTTTLTSGEEHFVFAHHSGRLIGLNWDASDDGEWDECILVRDTDGYHHVLLCRPGGEVRLLTRREPGQPDDWENRGVVTEMEVIKSEAEPDS